MEWLVAGVFLMGFTFVALPLWLALEEVGCIAACLLGVGALVLIVSGFTMLLGSI